LNTWNSRYDVNLVRTYR